MLSVPADKKLFFQSPTPEDPRLGSSVEAAGKLASLSEAESFLNSLKPRSVIFGYPDDEGIKINGGRIGASLGPDSIRRFFYRMTPSLLHTKPAPLVDLGNLDLALAFETRHVKASEVAKAALSSGHKWIGLGGGHDYGFSEGKALIEWCQKSGAAKPLVINFDAHLDVRPPTNGFNSGTPFYRLLKDYQGKFDFAEIGIQSQCNSREHLKWLKDQGSKVIFMDSFLDSEESFVQLVKKELSSWLAKDRPTFVSVDIDAFSAGVAMGASQSWPSGLLPNDFLKLFRNLQSLLDIKVLGVYEVSPPLDFDNITSKLAAQILHHFVFGD